MAAASELEVFHWWAGDEGPALEALIELFEAQHPEVQVQSEAVAGGAGTVAKAVLKTRMRAANLPTRSRCTPEKS